MSISKQNKSVCMCVCKRILFKLRLKGLDREKKLKKLFASIYYRTVLTATIVDTIRK